MFAVVAAAAAAGCFTHPINRAPVISELDQVGSAPKGMMATFMARGSDPDQDQLTWTWAETSPEQCKDPKVSANWPHDTTTGQPDAPATYIVDDSSVTSNPYCVWAFATDRYGAVDADNLLVDPADNLPVAVIHMLLPQLVPPYPAYSAFQLSAEASDADNDPLTYTWTLTQTPVGSTAAFVPCKGESNFDDDDTLRCFTADLAGTYSVSLAVNDGSNTTYATPATLMVLPDAPPCIDMTEPMYAQMNQKAVTSHGSVSDPGNTDPGMIAVSGVYDDGDPFPVAPGGKPPHFFWYLGKNDGKPQYVDNVDYQQLPLSIMDYQLDDVANVRLEVKDRNPDAVDKILAKCGDAADFCSAPTIPAGRVDCYVRVSWRILLDL